MMVQAFKGKDSGCEAKIMSSFGIDYVPKAMALARKKF